MLVDFKIYFDFIWVVWGDLNEILYNYEKIGGVVKDKMLF